MGWPICRLAKYITRAEASRFESDGFQPLTLLPLEQGRNLSRDLADCGITSPLLDPQITSRDS